MKNLKFALFLFILLFAVLACGGGGAIAAATEAPPQPTAATAPQSEPVPAEIYNDFYQLKTKDGTAAVEAFLADHPENAEALALKAGFYYRIKNYDAALTAVNHAIDLDPNLAFGYAVRASILYRQDGESKATEEKADIEKALQLDPNLALAYEVRGKINYYFDKNVDQAQADFEQALSLQPEYISPKLYLAEISIDNEDYQAAVDMLDQVLETYSDAVVLSRRSYAKYKLGDLEGAIADATASIQADAKNPAPYVWRGYAYDAQDQTDKALADFEMAISLGTNNADAFDHAAVDIAYQGGDYQKALEYAKKAQELEPDDLYHVDTEAYVYYQMAEYDKALEIYNTLIEKGYTRSYYWRGSTYDAMGKAQEAISDYQAYLAEYPDGNNSDDAKQRLTELGAQ